jgi:glycosyltransferase involved in cell wall biosynthesis
MEGNPSPGAVSESTRIRVTYLVTTFPKPTELFLQREIRALRFLPVALELHSLWGGDREFEGLAVHRFAKWAMFSLLWWIPYWLVRRPVVFASMLGVLAQRRVPSWKNLGETLVGLAFGLLRARAFERRARPPDLIHAAWATMPATAALLINRLTEIPFTMSAHAYDVFQRGGDWLMCTKLEAAARVIASTHATREELIRRGACGVRVDMVPGGLFPIPVLSPCRYPREALRVLSVGRLVEKKGLCEQLSILAEMKRRGISFEGHIVGDGLQRQVLRTRIGKLGLSEAVTMKGGLPFNRVLDELAWADVLLFTGKIASDGDRTDVAGIPELIEDGRNGVLLNTLAPAAWIGALLRLRDDDVYYQRLRMEGRADIEARYDARATTRLLLNQFRAAR